MLDIVVKNGQVVTPEGVGAWDIRIEGARIAAVAFGGTLPTDGGTSDGRLLARRIDGAILRRPAC